MSIEEKGKNLLRDIVASGSKAGERVRANTHKWAAWSGAQSNYELYKKVMPWLKTQGFLNDTEADGVYELTEAGHNAGLPKQGDRETQAP